MVGAHKPALQQRHHPMHGVQEARGLGRIPADHGGAVAIPLVAQRHVALPAVRMHGAPGLDAVLDKGHQAVGREVRNLTEAHPSELRAAHLDGNDDTGFSVTRAACDARLDRSHEAIVHLDRAAELVAPRSHHRPAELLKPGPGRLVAVQPEQPHQPLGAAPSLLGAHPSHRPESDPQRLARPREDRPGSQGRLAAAPRALNVVASIRPPAIMATLWTAKTPSAIANGPGSLDRPPRSQIAHSTPPVSWGSRAASQVDTTYWGHMTQMDKPFPLNSRNAPPGTRPSFSVRIRRDVVWLGRSPVRIGRDRARFT